MLRILESTQDIKRFIIMFCIRKYGNEYHAIHFQFFLAICLDKTGAQYFRTVFLLPRFYFSVEIKYQFSSEKTSYLDKKKYMHEDNFVIMFAQCIIIFVLLFLIMLPNFKSYMKLFFWYLCHSYLTLMLYLLIAYIHLDLNSLYVMPRFPLQSNTYLCFVILFCNMSCHFA